MENFDFSKLPRNWAEDIGEFLILGAFASFISYVLRVFDSSFVVFARSSPFWQIFDVQRAPWFDHHS